MIFLRLFSTISIEKDQPTRGNRKEDFWAIWTKIIEDKYGHSENWGSGGNHEEKGGIAGKGK